VTWLRASNAPGVAEAYICALEVESRLPFPGDGALVAHCIRDILNRIGDPFGSQRGRAKYEELVPAITRVWPVRQVTSSGSENAQGDMAISAAARKAVEELIAKHQEGEDRDRGKFEVVLRAKIGQAARPDQIEPVARLIKKIKEGAPNAAHFMGVSENRTDAAVWLGELRLIEQAFLALASPFFDHKDAIDRLLDRAHATAGVPDEQFVRNTCLAIALPEYQAYFFQRLQNPLWIGPLRKLGLLSTAPPQTEKNGAPVFELWPQGGYLVRMAPLPDAHDELTEVLANLQDNNNPFARAEIVKVVLGLPSPRAAVYAKKIGGWASGPGAWVVSRDLAPLVTKLVNDGFCEEAMHIVRPLTAIEMPNGGEHDYLASANPKSGMEAWHYVEFLDRDLPPIEARLGRALVTTLCRALDFCLRRESSRADRYSDGSKTWRREITEQHERTDIQGALTSALVRAVERVKADDEAGAQDVLSSLLKQRRLIFDRLAIHGLLRWTSTEIPASILATRALFFDLFTPEYQSLLRLRMGELSQEDRATLRAWLSGGFNVDAWKANVREHLGIELTPTDVDQLVKEWRVQRLWALETDPDFGKERADELSALVGAGFAGEARVHPRTRGAGGFVGPATIDDPRPWTMEDACTSLASRDTRAESDNGGANPLRGLSSTAVQRDPQPFALALAKTTSDLPLRPLSIVIQGLWEAQIGGKTFEWSGVLSHCRKACAISVGADDSELAETSDVFKRTVASLIQHALERNLPFAPEELREIRELLVALCEDADPTPARDTSEVEQDPYTRSINTVRSSALHALIELVGRLSRVSKEWQGLSGSTDLLKVLEAHLHSDPSSAVRATYGSRFPVLFDADPQWATAAAPYIFQAGPRFRAAWDAYVRAWQPSELMFTALRAAYDTAVNLLPGGQSEGADEGEADRHLAYHLMYFYARGHLPLDSLTTGFLARAKPGLRGIALSELGRSLGPARIPLPIEMADRLMVLWESRVVSLAELGSAEQEELMSFGTWISSGHFETPWLLAKLYEVVQRTRSARLAFAGSRVLERLAGLAFAHPKEVNECLQLMVVHDPDNHLLFGTKDLITSTLSRGLAAGGEAKTLAEGTIDTLGRRGRLEFGDLLTTQRASNRLRG